VRAGTTDLERLIPASWSILGCGVPPVFAAHPYNRSRRPDVPGRAEVFATTRDVYLWLGDLPEQPDDRDTADGRPATRDAQATGLARIVCADRTMLKQLRN